jgi:hypothetical protein
MEWVNIFVVLWIKSSLELPCASYKKGVVMDTPISNYDGIQINVPSNSRRWEWQEHKEKDKYVGYNNSIRLVCQWLVLNP